MLSLIIYKVINCLGVLLFQGNSNCLHLQVLLDTLRPQLPPMARLLEPSKWCLSQSVVIAVDPDTASLDCLAEHEGLVDILGDDTCKTDSVKMLPS